MEYFNGVPLKVMYRSNKILHKHGKSYRCTHLVINTFWACQLFDCRSSMQSSFLGGRGLLVLLVPPFWFYCCVMSPLTGRRKTPYDEQNPLFWVLHEVKPFKLTAFSKSTAPVRCIFMTHWRFFCFCFFTYLNVIMLQIHGWREGQIKHMNYIFNS